MPAAEHPTAADLQSFANGALADEAARSVESHLADCPSCLAVAVAAPDDTLVTLFRSAETSQSGPVTPGTAFAETVGLSRTDASSTADRPSALADHPKYRLIRPLGRGGMGHVWLAEHTVMNRPVALKVVRPEYLDRPEAVERFRREVRAAAKLSHPNIVAAHDAEQAGGTHFLVMEYIDGETLAERIEAGPVPVADACRWTIDAARGLDHARANGLIHRDVKPHNLIRERATGRVKVLDFGLAGVSRRRSERADRRQHGHRHAGLHRPGAGRGRPHGRHAVRRLLARLHLVPPAGRPAAVSRRVGPEEARRPPHATAGAADGNSSGHDAGAGRTGCPDAGQEPRRTGRRRRAKWPSRWKTSLPAEAASRRPRPGGGGAAAAAAAAPLARVAIGALVLLGILGAVVYKLTDVADVSVSNEAPDQVKWVIKKDGYIVSEPSSALLTGLFLPAGGEYTVELDRPDEFVAFPKSLRGPARRKPHDPGRPCGPGAATRRGRPGRPSTRAIHADRKTRWSMDGVAPLCGRRGRPGARRISPGRARRNEGPAGERHRRRGQRAHARPAGWSLRDSRESLAWRVMIPSI